MNHRDIAVLMDGIAPVLRGYVETAFAPIGARMLALEKRFDELPQPRDGKDADPVLILRLVEETVGKIPPAPAGADGKDADPALVADLVEKAVSAIKPAKDGEPGPPGQSVTVEQLAPLVAETVAKEIERIVPQIPSGDKGEPGEPGKSVTAEELMPLVVAEVAKAVSLLEPPALPVEEIERIVSDKVSAAVAEMPSPRDGKDADPAQVAALVVAEVEKAVAAIPVAKDGVGLAGALIDRDGNLVVTLTDGNTKTLGAVVGKDVDLNAVAEMVKAEVAKIPTPKDGVDGVGFDDIDLVEVDGLLNLRFSRGDTVKDFIIPVPIDQGVWTEKPYRKGSGVTWGGSFWIAQKDTSAKPDTPDSGWRLAVKRGRDGKAGDPGKKGDPGTPGRPGRDLTQMTLAGDKY